MGFEAGQHQGLWSGETMVGGSSFRICCPGESVRAEAEMVVSRYLRRLGLVGWVCPLRW